MSIAVFVYLCAAVITFGVTISLALTTIDEIGGRLAWSHLILHSVLWPITILAFLAFIYTTDGDGNPL